MKDLAELDKWRIAPPHFWQGRGGPGDSGAGAFDIRRNGITFRVIATTDALVGWEHVSVSTRKRCPVWEEMDWIANLFFEPDEAAIQFHVPPSDHVNCHPFCLHWWRPLHVELPRPPSILVGPKT